MMARNKVDYDSLKNKIDAQLKYEVQYVKGNQRILYNLDQNDKIYFCKKTTPSLERKPFIS